MRSAGPQSAWFRLAAARWQSMESVSDDIPATESCDPQARFSV